MELFKELAINNKNPGAYSGHGWHSLAKDKSLTIISPTSGEELAQVYECSTEDYAVLIQRAKVASLIWRETPAPKRGEIIRQIADLLRQHKDALGSLISLEMGKP